MASRKKPPKAPALDEARVGEELAMLRQRLSSEGGVKLSTVKPKRLAERLLPVLLQEGFEASKTWLRRPLGEQIVQALAHGAALDRRALVAHVRGATAAELQRALTDVERAGRLRRVLRGKAEVFVAGSAAALSAEALPRLRRVVSTLDKMLSQAARKQGLTLLASDVQQALEEAARLVPRAVSGSAAEGGVATPAANGRASAASEGAAEAAGAEAPAQERALCSVVAAVGAARDERSGLSYVPDIVRRLLPEMPAAVARDMLLLAARRELVELRPEGGLGRLTAEDLELCPPGPARTHLSWARVLGGGQG